jgi:hypothetical protein
MDTMQRRIEAAMKIKECVVTAVTVAVLGAAGVTTVVTGNHDFSENENRYLTKFPAITLSGILSGEVQEEIADAFADQFPLRDRWTAATTDIQKKLGFQDIGGVYLGKDGYYFAKTGNEDISQTNYFQNLRFVNGVAATCPNATVTAMLVPSPATVMADWLPAHATIYDADRMYQEAADMLQGVKLLDIREELTAEAGNVYFRTDHHWNEYGAYLGYRAYCKKIRRRPGAYEDYDVETVSSTFYGTLYSKVLDSSAKADEINAPTVLPEVSCVCDGTEIDGIYDESKLSTKDKYAYYFGGNFGEVIIKNKNAKKKTKLLVIKDSFANSMIPYLLKDYAEIRMLDLRYYKESAQEYLKEYEPEEILVLFELSNFAKEEHLNRLTK